MVDTLADMIRERAVDHADAPAIAARGETITFAELDRGSNQVANALHAAGIRRGDRVAVLDRTCPSSSSCCSARPSWAPSSPR